MHISWTPSPHPQEVDYLFLLSHHSNEYGLEAWRLQLVPVAEGSMKRIPACNPWAAISIASSTQGNLTASGRSPSPAGLAWLLVPAGWSESSQWEPGSALQPSGDLAGNLSRAGTGLPPHPISPHPIPPIPGCSVAGPGAQSPCAVSAAVKSLPGSGSFGAKPGGRTRGSSSHT